MKIKIFAALFVLLLSGCTTPSDVVTTEISLNKKDGTLHIASPKDISISGMTYERTEQGVKVSIQTYESKGNPEALSAVQKQYEAVSETAKALQSLTK